ncbi:MAG TPA: SMC family ATPase [Capsulimonadaceae bacterium]|jgi:exonuclease SbcC
MIPVHLQLKNFMSYGEEPVDIDFTGMHTVCLSGENGHGKSALLDAITWALWGETRLGKQNHEQLIRIGADEMAVIFTFEVNGQLYRIRRQRSKRSSGQLWELQQADGIGGWRPLTGTGATDTARSIQQLLRMSYDTFLNSAYLRQGRADEFVRQTANKRKEILGEILDLSRYDELENLARLRSREAHDNAVEAERRANLATAIAAEEPALVDRRVSCLGDIATAAEEQAALTAEWDKARESHHQLKAKQQQAQRIAADLRAVDADMKRVSTERENETKASSNLGELIGQKVEIHQDYDKLVEARSTLDALEIRVAELQAVERQRLNATHEIESERRALAMSLDTERRDLDATRKQIADREAVRQTADRLAPRIADLSGAVDNIPALRTKDIEARERFAELKHQRDVINSKLDAIATRIKNLDNQVEACSVCGSPLPPEKIAGLVDEARADGQDLERQKSAVIREAAELKAGIDRIKADLDTAEVKRSELERVSREMDAAERVLAELPALEQRQSELDRSITVKAGQLERNDYAQEAQKSLADLTVQLAALKGADQELEQTRLLVRRLANAEKRYHDLTHAQATLDATKQRVDGLTAQLSQMSLRRTALHGELDALRGVEDEIKELEGVAERLRVQRQTIADRIAACQQERGRLDESIQRCEKARTDAAAFEADKTLHRRDEELYKQLTGAFGKQGVQALIIENAVPELQADTNLILEKLTDGDLTVQIDTQKLAKTKGAATIETLEILISDHLGTRPLELYSGGESFRVSFALRIALSNLLARRAGARLQTLIIDEGFGTQDAKGREKLVDAINAIKDDFERIIVITHIDELKEAFPSRIDVYKTPEGSQVTITEGGIIG